MDHIADIEGGKALCWLKKGGQAINDIRAGVSYLLQSKIDLNDQMV